MAKTSKGMSDEEFNAHLRAERTRSSPGMVMTKPPTGPSKSLEEMLKDQDQGEIRVTSPVLAEKKQPILQATYVQGKKLQMIDVAFIDANPLAPREVYTAEMILARSEALRTQGQHDPIHVIPNPDQSGRYIICDGWTRVQACRKHKVLEQLLAEIHENLSLEESAWFGYQQNEERQQHCDFDRAMFYEKLINAGETAISVANKAQVSASQMSFYRSFAKLPADVLEIVKEFPGKFSATVAYQIQKLAAGCGVRKAVSLALKFANEDHTQAWLINQVQLLIGPSSSKTVTRTTKQIRYSNGVYKQKGELFELNISVLPEQKEQFAEALERLLSTVAIETPQIDVAANKTLK
jgi:ParB family chromosome partitioning protein